jgi:hypothetical protein
MLHIVCIDACVGGERELGKRVITAPPVLENATSSPPMSDLGHPSPSR